MLSLAVFLIVLSVLVLVHELGHFFASKRIGVRVECFSLGFGPKLFSVKRGDTEYALSSVPLGGYVKLAGDDPSEKRTNERHEYLSRSIGERAQIILAGPIVNYVMAFLLFSFIFMVGSPTLTTEVGGILPDYPAKSAGLKVGDIVISADGRGVKYWEDLTEIIHKKQSGSLNLVVKRGSGEFNVRITPKVKSYRDIFGKESRIALIGIIPSEKIEKVRYGIVGSCKMSARRLAQLTSTTYKAIWSIMTRRLSVKDSMTGPLGIFVITGKAVNMGIIYILHLMALLSTSLAIFNLLPIPVLDGGHMLFLLIEKVRGRPLAVRTQEIITNFGIAALALLMLYVVYADIVRFQLVERIMKFIGR